MRTLFIFIDESGNFDFSPKGTKYFILSAVSTLKPPGKRKARRNKIRFNEGWNQPRIFSCHGRQTKL